MVMEYLLVIVMKILFLIPNNTRYTNSSSRPSFFVPPFSRPSTGKSGFAKYPHGTQTHLHDISIFDFIFSNTNALKSSENVEADTIFHLKITPQTYF
jgi:hypothetical protein